MTKDDDYLQADDAAIKAAEQQRTHTATATTTTAAPQRRDTVLSTPSRPGDEDALDARVIEDQTESYYGELDFLGSDTSREDEYKEALKPPYLLALWSKLLCFFILAGAALCGMLLITQIASFWADIASLPPALRWGLSIACGIFALALLFVITRIFCFLWKYRSLSSINLTKVKSLSHIEKYKAYAQRDMEKCKNELLQMLKAYDTRKLSKYKLKDSQILGITAYKNELLEKSDGILTAEGWLQEYQEKFQAELITIAKARIRAYALKVGAGTAVSPIAIIDQGLVIYGSLCMSRDIFEIFNLKLSKLDNIKLLAWAIYATYFAGVAQEMITESGANIIDGLSDPELMSELGTFATKFVTVNATSGVANALFTWRIGSFTLRKITIKI